MLVDDCLLRTSTGCTTPLSSSTLYDDWLNLIVISVMSKSYIHKMNSLQSSSIIVTVVSLGLLTIKWYGSELELEILHCG